MVTVIIYISGIATVNSHLPLPLQIAVGMTVIDRQIHYLNVFDFLIYLYNFLDFTAPIKQPVIDDRLKHCQDK